MPEYLILRTGGWSLVNISGDGTVWSVNSSQFIREKMTGSDAFYSLSVGFDEDARQYSLVVSKETLSYLCVYITGA